MGVAQEICEEIFEVIQGGANLGDPAKIIEFPSDNGANTFKVVQQTYKNANGTGFNYWVAAAVTVVEGVRTAVSAGAAYLAMEVGTFGAFVAPALGIATGYGMYNLTPAFWNRVGKALSDAGYTVSGKVIAYLNEYGIISYHPGAIEIFKNALIEEGIFDFNQEMPAYTTSGTIPVVSSMNAYKLMQFMESNLGYSLAYDPTVRANILTEMARHSDDLCCLTYRLTMPETWVGIGAVNFQFFRNADEINLESTGSYFNIVYYIEKWHPDDVATVTGYTTQAILTHPWQGMTINDNYMYISGINAEGGLDNEDALQKGAHYPDTRYFPDLYPDWTPEEFPDISGEQLPETYPLQYPDLLPDKEPQQGDSQDPDTESPTFPDKVIETITDPENDPFRKPWGGGEAWYEEDPDPEVDPDEQEDIDYGEEIPEPGDDPVDPDPDIPPSPIIPVPPVPSTISSSKLFTVYNPSQGALDSLGAYLWDNDLMDILKKIWQNPLDGIISLIQVYCTPSSGSAHNIILGYLDSGVSAPVVTSQFVTIDCGSIQIKEQNKNCTDYIPYTSMELYLPFIGIVEIDTNEFMGGTINVKYIVDVYTGTCIAQVKCTRTKDISNGAILYSYSGNCSQQIPLTSGDARGVLSTLIGAAGAGLSIASGGSFGVMAAASMIGNTMGREMLHVSHSGNLSANAGIMGQKKPYLILNRKRPYNANNYNRYYGYPVNKTVYLGNYFGLGYMRVKAQRLTTSATQREKAEILQLLHDGIIL